ncbi:hypothetical protein JKP88DRAFT_229924 [Tribonema minus]|uniref:Uncharacterized protein n=1 Tax=Tribonema minus TaxID=303371 RepID=A0A836CPB6_9STRA|nr:hypothetical protein JKP88DRAFT_229924 [Tribonema minus]
MVTGRKQHVLDMQDEAHNLQHRLEQLRFDAAALGREFAHSSVIQRSQQGPPPSRNTDYGAQTSWCEHTWRRDGGRSRSAKRQYAGERGRKRSHSPAGNTRRRSDGDRHAVRSRSRSGGRGGDRHDGGRRDGDRRRSHSRGDRSRSRGTRRAAAASAKDVFASISTDDLIWECERRKKGN